MPLIVIVDDRAINRKIFSKLSLTIQDDVSVETFDNPGAALAWMAEHPADLVITDYKMPQMDGADFTRALRRLPMSGEVPVIVITAYDDWSFRMEALEAGATDFLQSPVDYSEFTTRARNLLKLSVQQKIIRSRADNLETELKKSEISREKITNDSKETLAQVIDNVPAVISATDLEGRCIFVNAYCSSLAGVDASELLGRKDTGLSPHLSRADRQSLDEVVILSGQVLPSFEEEITDPSGRRITFMTTKAPLRDAAGDLVGVLTTSLDITDRKVAETRLVFLAQHDHLTSLPNRAFLHERLQQELARGRREDHVFAVHFLDLDRFKGINDGLGHHFGDCLLKAVAERLRRAVRGSDFVARLGGDEFAIIQTDAQGPEDAAILAERVIRAFEDPFTIKGKEVATSASIGITLHPKDGRSADELLQNADLAMYRVKMAGRNGYQFFFEDMLIQAKQAILLQAELRTALAQSQFVLHYQPQADLRTGEIVGAEALLRWQRPGVGLVGPSEFLLVAEDSGLILGINEWVLREACRQAVAWLRDGTPVRVAVNLSALQFQKQDLCSLVMGVLETTGLPASLLELELTEGILLEHAEAAAAALEQLHAHGVRFSIDDFGTGHSSLSHLKGVHVDRLKIDRSFIHNLEVDPNDIAIVRAIIGLGRALNLEVLAEGVETVEQLAVLRAEGCDSVQGYYFSRPLAAADLQMVIREERLRAAPASMHV